MTQLAHMFTQCLRIWPQTDSSFHSDKLGNQSSHFDSVLPSDLGYMCGLTVAPPLVMGHRVNHLTEPGLEYKGKGVF